MAVLLATVDLMSIIGSYVLQPAASSSSIEGHGRTDERLNSPPPSAVVAVLFITTDESISVTNECDAVNECKRDLPCLARRQCLPRPVRRAGARQAQHGLPCPRPAHC
mmetsp:Transcript_46240/g.128516  ORF Transcript_46240/g.128516 Transcript_46240/m.128516 type:complete len:108 (+) Transcript_46240:235-558(+)|eukprot:6363656-Prymnesium_polylepis.1